MPDLSYIHKPYQRHTFWVLFLPSIAVAFAFGITIYVLMSRFAFEEIQHDLRTIASTAAQLVPVETHEKLIDREQMDDPEYKEIESLFQTFMGSNPRIDDLYTMRPTKDPNVYIFVTSGDVTRDKDGDGVIDESELKAELGEEYDTQQAPQIREATSGVKVDEQITYDKWGSWVSGYAPLKNEQGATVAIVGVDFSADVFADEKSEVLKAILYSILIAIPVIGIICFLIARRLASPIKILASGIEKVLHGDHDFHLPEKGAKDKRIFAEIFNHLIDAFGKKRPHDVSEENEDHK